MNESEKSPKVSVVVITHRRVEILKRAVKSVLAQTYSNLELIIVNDGSNDATEPYLDALHDSNSKIKVIHHAVPRGACAARNSGIRAATGEFVAGLDDDDEFMPDRIECLVAAYGPKYAYVCAQNELVVDGQCSVHWKPRKIKMSMLMWFNVVDNQILAPRSLFFKAGLFDESLPSAQDYDMWVRMLEVSDSDVVYCVQKPLQKIYVEVARASVTTKDKKKRRGSWIFYKKHKPKMSKLQRAAFLYRLGSIQGKASLVQPLAKAAKLGKFISINGRLLAR